MTPAPLDKSKCFHCSRARGLHVEGRPQAMRLLSASRRSVAQKKRWAETSPEERERIAGKIYVAARRRAQLERLKRGTLRRPDSVSTIVVDEDFDDIGF